MKNNYKIVRRIVMLDQEFELNYGEKILSAIYADTRVTLLIQAMAYTNKETQ